MSQDSILSMIGLAKRAGKVVSGEFSTEKAVKENKAKLVISSSLHGIILAETYGIPAILLMDKVTNNMFKYNDYYYRFRK